MEISLGRDTLHGAKAKSRELDARKREKEGGQRQKVAKEAEGIRRPEGEHPRENRSESPNRGKR